MLNVMDITREEINAFCEAMKERMVRELSNGTKVEVSHNIHYDLNYADAAIGETISIRFGEGPEIV
jgi:hypothetical protein